MVSINLFKSQSSDRAQSANKYKTITTTDNVYDTATLGTRLSLQLIILGMRPTIDGVRGYYLNVKHHAASIARKIEQCIIYCSIQVCYYQKLYTANPLQQLKLCISCCIFKSLYVYVSLYTYTHVTFSYIPL